MAFKVDKKDGYSIVTIEVDKLDSNIAPTLKSELVLINSDGERNIIIDLSATRYCDSSGLSAILVGNRLCKNSGGNFILSGLKDTVTKLIVLSQLDSILTITRNLQEAEEKIALEAKEH